MVTRQFDGSQNLVNPFSANMLNTMFTVSLNSFTGSIWSILFIISSELSLESMIVMIFQLTASYDGKKHVLKLAEFRQKI